MTAKESPLLANPAHVVGLPKAAVGPLLGFRAQLESLRSVLGVLRPSELLDHVIEVMNLEEYYKDGTPQGEARLENLRELRGLAVNVACFEPCILGEECRGDRIEQRHDLPERRQHPLAEAARGRARSRSGAVGPFP